MSLIKSYLLKIIKFLDKKAWIFLILLVFVLTISYSTLSILRHNHFQSGGFDLGIYDQAIWQYSKFISPYNTVKDRFILGDHLTLTLPLISPLFYLWDDVRILLIFQAFWISFSSIAVYKIAKIRKLSSLTSLNLSFVYLLFYGIQYAIFSDFHPVVIGVGLLAWLAYFLESRKKKLFLLSLILTLFTQENMGIAVACLGLIYFFKKEYRKIALKLIFFGFISSFIAAKVIALFSPFVGFQYSPEITLNPLEIFKRYFDSSEKILVWLYSYSLFVLLPLLSIGSLLAVTLDLSQYFITGNDFARMWSPFMHHRAILAVFLILGVLDALEILRNKQMNFYRVHFSKINPQTVSILLVFITIFLQYIFHFPINKLTKADYWRYESWMNDNNTLFKMIPKEASLATAQNLIPHLSHRKYIYLVWPRLHDFEDMICGQKSCWWLDFAGKPEYLVIDLRPNQWVTQLLETNENFQKAVKNMEKAGKIELVREINDAKLYKINY